MSLLDKLKEQKAKSATRRRAPERQILDAIMVAKYAEIRNALESGYAWNQVYNALKEELVAAGMWNANWDGPRIYATYAIYRRFKAIEEAGIKYQV